MCKVPGKQHVVRITDPNARCRNCGNNLSELGSFNVIAGETIYDGPKFRLEPNKCKACGKQFLLRYDLFDRDGHVSECVFRAFDINDDSFDFRSLWTPEQIKQIENHAFAGTGCATCISAYNEAVLDEAKLKSLFKSLRNPFSGDSNEFFSICA